MKQAISINLCRYFSTCPRCSNIRKSSHQPKDLDVTDKKTRRAIHILDFQFLCSFLLRACFMQVVASLVCLKLSVWKLAIFPCFHVIFLLSMMFFFYSPKQIKKTNLFQFKSIYQSCKTRKDVGFYAAVFCGHIIQSKPFLFCAQRGLCVLASYLRGLNINEIITIYQTVVFT